MMEPTKKWQTNYCDTEFVGVQIINNTLFMNLRTNGKLFHATRKKGLQVVVGDVVTFSCVGVVPSTGLPFQAVLTKVRPDLNWKEIIKRRM